MISLAKLAPPANQTLFERHPELNGIWEVEALQSHARDSYGRWGVDADETTGEVFSIDLDGVPIGITGWFEDGLLPDVLRLRYYGVAPRWRGHGYGEESMRLLLARLAEVAPARYAFLSESVSLGRAVAARIIAHFERMGFAPFDDHPGYGENAGCGPVRSLRVRIPGR